VLTYPVSERWLDEAQARSKEGGLNEHTDVKDDIKGQITGHLTEFAFGRALKERGIPFEKINPPPIWDYDFLVGSARIDTKGKFRRVDIRPHYTCDAPEYQQNAIDFYVFGSWNSVGKRIQLVAAASQKRFKEHAEVIPKGEIFDGRPLTSNRLVAHYKDFHPFKDYLEWLDLYTYQIAFGEKT